MPITLAVACANVCGGCIAMAQLYQFDPEGEAPEEIQTLWLQQDL